MTPRFTTPEAAASSTGSSATGAGKARLADPDLDGVDVEPASDLDLIRAELTADVAAPPVLLDVPGRPGYQVRYSTEIDAERVAGWEKRAKDKTWSSGTNGLRVTCILLASNCLAILRQGVEVRDGDGEPLTFRSPELW